jgi:hypothetical protein
MKYYCGVGSRETPDNILQEMKSLASILEKQNYCLRSGGAKGADTWFARGTNNAQIWLPWKDFNIGERNPKHTYKIIDKDDKFANKIVDEFHPIGKTLRGKTRLLMMRNTYQVLGWWDASDSQFVICWTSDGEASGGTGQAIRIANHYGIPVYNMYHLNKDQILKEITKLNLLQ